MPMVRRRRPILRAAGAAAVGGAAYRAGQRGAQEPEGPSDTGSSYYAPAEAPTEAPAGAPTGSPTGSAEGAGLSSETIDQLGELGRLHEQGILTDEEFEEQKRRYLQGG